jgi:uncharacterized protein (TIGR02147 family)
LHILITMKDLETYSDYRQFLKDYFAERKKQNNAYSYRMFCQLAGISSPSYYKEVVEGKRNLSQKYMGHFIRGLKLREKQADFFAALVKFNQAKTEKEKQLQLEQLRKARSTVPQRLVPASHYSYYSKWYHSAIRELACTLDWKGDYKLLAKSLDPRISVKEARESVRLLVDLGFIEKTAAGDYRQKDAAITTGPEVMSLGVRKFNHELSGMGQSAITRHSPSERDISAVVMGLSEEGYTAIKGEIQEFYRKVISLVNNDKVTSRVYSVVLQLFPLSKEFGKPAGANGEARNAEEENHEAR